MKKRILILLLAICMCFSGILVSCNKTEPETTEAPTQTTTSQIISDPFGPRIYSFDDYTSFVHAFDSDSDSAIQKEKSLFKEYEPFIDHLIETKNIMIPQLNGTPIPLDNEKKGGKIFLFNSRSGLPYIEYYIENGEYDVCIEASYPTICGIEGITNDMSASEVIRLIDEDTINLHNYQQYNGLEYMYTKNLVLADAEVSALIWHYEYNSIIFVSFYYKDTLLKFYNLYELLPDEFWKSFSLESVANGALNP